MTKRAAISGTYYNLRPVVGRKVCQVIIEIPIEKMTEFVDAFGSPSPDTWVALARMNLETGRAQPVRGAGSDVGEPRAPASRPKQSWREMLPAQQAGILCADPAFIKYLEADMNHAIHDESGATAFVREHCGITSRAELNTNTTAAEIWRTLVSNYRAWMHEPEVV